MMAYSTGLRLKLTAMPGWKRVAFMACCCERMFPNYERFQREESYGDATVLRSGLDLVWDWVAATVVPLDREKVASACEVQAPFTGEHASVYTSAALDASAALAVTLRALIRAPVESAIEVASYATDTVDLFVQSSEDIDPTSFDFEDVMAAHPLMQSEIELQWESLQLLERCTDRTATLAELRAHSPSLCACSLPLTSSSG